MEKRAILLDEKDNVATCTSEVRSGDLVKCSGGGSAEITAAEEIPCWHKIARAAIKKGDRVYKYGEVIGEALAEIQPGAWVSEKNIRSIPRDYSREYLLTKGEV